MSRRAHGSLLVKYGFFLTICGFFFLMFVSSTFQELKHVSAQNDDFDGQFPIFSQNFDPSVVWNRTWDFTGSEDGKSLWIDDNFIYTQGSSNNDDLLVKWSKNGTQIWNRTWGGIGSETSEDVWGDGSNLYTCGYTTSYSLNTMYVLKRDYAGNLLWNRTWAHGAHGTGIWGNGGFIYVTGFIWYLNSWDMMLVKWDGNGNWIWNRSFSYSSSCDEYSYGIWGNSTDIYTCGSTEYGSGSNNVLLVKWDHDGNVVWSRYWGDDGGDYAMDVWGNDDGVYLTGYANRYYVSDIDGLLLMKWSSGGILRWYRVWNSVNSEMSSAIWGNDASVFTFGYNYDPASYKRDLLLIKWDLQGNQISNHTWGGVNDEYGNDIFGDNDFVYTIGETTSFVPGGLLLLKWDLVGYQLMIEFSTNVTFIKSGESVQFTYTGSHTYARSYQWDFGDGSVNSTMEDPVHKFTTGGNHTVILTVNDTIGNVRVMTKRDFIFVQTGLHSKIFIDGNNALDNFPDKIGNGSDTDPYIIRKLTINADHAGSAILIQNTNRFFIIDNCSTYFSGPLSDDAGIRLVNCTNIIIQQNYAFNNSNGIHVQSSNNIGIIGNRVNYNMKGIYLDESTESNATGNSVLNSDMYGIYVVYSSANVIKQNNLSSNDIAFQAYADFQLSYADNNTIQGNNILNSGNRGMELDYSNGNEITGNRFNNNWRGIVGSTCKDLWIYRNNITDKQYGIQLSSCDDSRLVENTVSGHSNYGIWLSSCKNTSVYKNVLINNVNQAYVYYISVSFDDGLNGNYWSDYQTKYSSSTSNGINWDYPYTISGTVISKDQFPLVTPFVYQGNIHAPTLSNPGVSPSTGDQNTLFNFTIVYSDADNTRPEYVQVVINGVMHAMTKHTSSDTNYVDGCLFQFTSNLVPGAYTYYFKCADRDFYAATANFTGLTVINSNMYTPLLEHPNASPGNGGTKSVFHFSVIYIDQDNNFPQSITITVDSTTRVMAKKNPADTNCIDGTDYTFSTKLIAGSHQYKIDCSDGLHSNTTGWLTGPFVDPLVDMRNITFFLDDFEGNLSQWSSITGMWHVTSTASPWPNPCHSQTHSMWFGLESSGTYNNGMCATGNLTTKPMDLSLSATAYLELFHWRASEAWYSFDSSYIYISTNGVNWNCIYSTTNQITPWQKLVLNISAYCGYESVLVRFTFDSFDGITNDYRGWLVDDVVVYSNNSAPPMTLISPANNNVLQNSLVEFRWTSINLPARAINYTWQLSSTLDFSQIVNEQRAIPNAVFTTSFNHGLHLPGGYYYWRVRPENVTASWSRPFILFMNEPRASFCSNRSVIIISQPVQFTFTGITGQLPVTYQWEFGDGSMNSTLQNPVHAYTTRGTFTVTLTVIDFDGDANTLACLDFIQVTSAIPVADFDANATAILVNQAVQFVFNGTFGDVPVTYHWNFGDGSMNSTLQNPVHAYTTRGTFTVTLTVIDFDGDANTLACLDFIQVTSAIPVADFDANATAILVNQAVQFVFNGTFGDLPVTYLWSFGDGSVSWNPNPSHAYVSEGRFTVSLIVTDKDGDFDAVEKVDFIHVMDLDITATFVANASLALCHDDISFIFTGREGSESVLFYWDFGDGSPGILSRDARHIYLTPGDFNVTLTIETAFNFSKSASFQIIILDPSSDQDNDGLSNEQELARKTNPQVADTDKDGMLDGWEVVNGCNPLLDDSSLDPDGDGLTNLVEFNTGTNPQRADTDADGMPDKWEIKFGLNPIVNDATNDLDSDGLANIDEFKHGCDPSNSDTDDDGFTDGQEVVLHTDPLSPLSNPRNIAIMVLIMAGILFTIAMTATIIAIKRNYRETNKRIESLISSPKIDQFHSDQTKSINQKAFIELQIAEARRKQLVFLPNLDIKRLIRDYVNLTKVSTRFARETLQRSFDELKSIIDKNDLTTALNLLGNINTRLNFVILDGLYTAEFQTEVQIIIDDIRKVLMARLEKCKHQLDNENAAVTGQLRAMMRCLDTMTSDQARAHVFDAFAPKRSTSNIN